MKKRLFFKKSILLVCSMLIMFQLQAQQHAVTGTVTDANDGSPLPGATIVIQGTSKGTSSDMNGKYQIQAGPDDVLVFSFVGYTNETATVGDRNVIDMKLVPSIKQLQELVVIGYGTVAKKDATGSISTVSADDFNKGAITTPQDLLVGKSAGVVITNSGGQPGGGATIRIRGGSSLNASNDPLVIVDGVPLDNNNVSGSSNFLNFINPNDIESFTVLKDASATAIYGSRASNGVILITTKKGTKGSPLKVSYNGYVSMANAIEFMDVYSGDEVRQIAYEKPGLFGADSYNVLGNKNTNWQKEIYRTAISHEHNLSVSGAYNALPYRVSVGYTDQNGILKNTDMNRVTGSINLTPTLLNNNLKVTISAKGMSTNQNFSNSGAVGNAIAMDPTQPVKDGNKSSDGYFQWGNYGSNLGTPNPVEQLLANDNKSHVLRGIANAQFDYTLPFLPDMKANLNLATDYTKSDGHNNYPASAPSPLIAPLNNGRLTDYSGKNTNNLLDFYLNYKKNLKSISSNIDVTAGYSWQHFQREGDNYTRGIVDSEHPYQMSDSTSFINENYLVSFFGRVNYSLMDRYLLTVTLRDDGSSRFIGKNKWGLFPSAAFAWKINDEPFMENVGSVSELKLRLGWGVTGQQDIGSYYPAQAQYISSVIGSYYPIGGEFLPTLRPNAYDPDIKWESTTTQNIGLDFGFINDRISGSVDVYKRVTDDLLNRVTIPSGSNFSNTLYTNVGSLENKGAEVTLNLRPISRENMSLTLGFNFTYNKNKITKLLLTNDPNYIGVGNGGDSYTGYLQYTRVGYPAHSFFMNKQVYDANGNPIEGLYVDLSGKGGAVSGTNADKYLYKNPNPDYLMGFSIRYNYKDFDFSASTRTSIGNYVYNQVASGASYDQMYQIGYWHNEPKFLSDTRFVKRQFTSDYFVENASFFKVDNISAGYTFNNIVNSMSARLSLTVQNAVTITNYTGIDPEVDLGGSNPGIDNNFYPRPRTFMLGLSLNF